VTDNTGLFNGRFAKNFIPLPPFNMPGVGELAPDFTLPYLPYPFLYDPDCITFRSYGAGQALGAPLPAQFVIDREGRITFRHLSSFTDSNAETNTILAELDKLSKA
jgi:AhpC/TSA family